MTRYMPLPTDEPISSTENPQVRLARSLLEPAGRRRHGAFLVEGLRLVEGASGVGAPRLVLYAPPFGQREGRERRLLLALRRMGCPVRPVTERVLAQVTDTVTPQGIVAVLPLPPEASLPSEAHPRAGGPAGAGDGEGGAPLVLVLDGVADPGNAGTLLRAAAGAGATAVLATRGTVDLFSPKVVRAGAGAHFLLPLRTGLDWEALSQALPGGCRVLLADAGAATPYWEADWRGPTAVVVSSEAHGASAGAVQRADVRVGIPVRGIESLNVAVAGSVLLFEAVRQRHGALQRVGHGGDGRDDEMRAKGKGG
jgi:TrmH family RNA methyltransferase